MQKSFFYKCLYSLPFVFFTALQSYAQVYDLDAKIETYQTEHPFCNLYVHADRNIYIPGDTIWFKSYMLSAHKSGVIYLRIVNEQKRILVEKQFPVYDLRSDGWIPLPDTLQDGDYFLYAYTDLMINFNPSDVFAMPLKIVPNTLKLIEMEAFATNGDVVRRASKTEIGIRIREQNKPLKKARAIYTIWANSKSIKTGRIRTNEYGEARVQFIYPAIADNESVRFEVKMEEEEKSASLFLNLRHEGNEVNVLALPEGGNLLEGVLNNVVFLTTDDNKNPVAVILKLFRGGNMLDSVQTDKNGIGQMSYVPQKGIVDSILILENNQSRKILMPLKAITTGYGLQIVHGRIIGSNDSVIVKNIGKPEVVKLVLRSLDKVVWTRDLSVPDGHSAKLAISIDSIPKGILSMTVFGATGIPEAERLFMNKQGIADGYSININTEKNTFGDHDRIKVNLSVLDQQQKPVMANLSVAVVEKRTLDTARYPTILQAYYYQRMSATPRDVLNEKQPSFDAILMTRSWRGYGWKDIIGYTPVKTLDLLSSPGDLYGKVNVKEKKMPMIENLMILAGGASAIVPINKDGSFTIRPEQLTVRSDEKKYLVLGRKFRQNYDIELTSYAAQFDEKVKSGSLLHFSKPFSTIAHYRPDESRIFNNEIQLPEVIVKSSKRGEVPMFGSNGDYVCKYFVLNCPIHPTNGSAPILGIVYLNKDERTLIIYNGVGKKFAFPPPGSLRGFPPAPPISILLPEIKYPLPFFLPDYSTSQSLGQDTRTTVFWTPNLNTDNLGNANFSFFTSDIRGLYTVVIQGIEMLTLRPIYYKVDLVL